jgi:uncharacterized protein
MPQRMKNFLEPDIKTRLEAAAFRRLLEHLQAHHDVQNIDLMLVADFCRNCLAKWYTAAAQAEGVAVDYEQAREIVYGMPYKDWQARYQTEATQEQLAALASKLKQKHE